MAINIRNPSSIVAAAAEFDALGRDEFLHKYRFGRARKYFLWLNGTKYDSKAIVGVARKFETVGGEPLAPAAFSGGEATVAALLRSLGFTVVKGATEGRPEALVLVENEATVGGEYDFWADETGVRYHFPNAYRNLIVTGTGSVPMSVENRSGATLPLAG